MHNLEVVDLKTEHLEAAFPDSQKGLKALLGASWTPLSLLLKSLLQFFFPPTNIKMDGEK